MKQISLWISLFFAISAASAAEENQLRMAAENLEQQSVSTLGVGIRSLSFLFEADPKNFILKESLVDEGSWKYLQLLEEKGFVAIKLIRTASGEYVQLHPTDKGRSVSEALR